MSKTPHPARAAGCTPKQIEAFEHVAAGNSSITEVNGHGVTAETVKTLMDKGLIEFVGYKHVGGDRFGDIHTPLYSVPFPVHVQWCKWCDENVSDEELENV